MEKKYKLLHIEIDKYLCNFKCNFCYLNFEKGNINFKYDYSKLPDVVDFCKNNNIIEIRIQGGEPTINKKTFEFCKAISENTNSLISVITNGTEFNEQWCELFAKSGNEVNFSLNSSNRETYKNNCGKDRFDDIIKNIRNFENIRHNYKKPPCILSASMVVTNNTIDEMAIFYELVSGLNADKVLFFPDLYSDYRLTPQNNELKIQYHTHFEKLLEKVKSNPVVLTNSIKPLGKVIEYNGRIPGIKFTNPIFNRHQWFNIKQYNSVYYLGKKHKGCLSPWSDIFIDNKLNVYPCCLISYNIEPLGNLKDNTLEEILSGNKLKALQNEILENGYKKCPVNCQIH